MNAQQAAVEAEMIAAGAAISSALADTNARLLRDAEALETRWMEVGTALEEAESRAAEGG